VTNLRDVCRFLDETLSAPHIIDYSRALNGLQLANQGDVFRVAAAVDFSLETIRQSVDRQANLLIVHHGMFWAGLQPIIGLPYARVRLAILNDVAVYASHLPLDFHGTFGNNAQLARQLRLAPTGRFGRYQTAEIGCSGTTNLLTDELVARVRTFVEPFGARLVTTPYSEARLTHHWAILTGAGASPQTIQEATDCGIDTLIVGEGPHHTAIDAQERGLVVIYAGHYATEVLGVQSLAAEIQRTFGIPWSFIDVPTGL
jgi:dinuclear metal center YbgI/SA1388 family protein